ncbi:unnamed protein product [Mytilus coruscus]|uniref:CCHC-type domain-containing protein n=1 Tax=Mytilus coruscus TaxID=42192 RepID=A0A6J8CPL0_MYTCO|nr:unnamed protein product [Mytilus coruscus]
MSQSELNRPNSGNSRRNPRDNRNRFSKQNYVTDNKYYQRECTVRVEKNPTKVIGERVVIEDTETLNGMNTVLAVVRCDLSSYDVTFDCKENAFKMLRGVEIANRDFECSMMFSDITVVSVIKLPSYICDDEITSKIESKGVKVVSPVYRRTVPGTQVADGTRFMRCKFPPGVVSLPWSMPFKFGTDTKYYRVVHNNQTKVCSECSSPEHMRKDCPHFLCYGCGDTGHALKSCRAKNPSTRWEHESRNREENKDNCPDCGQYFCMCKCRICGNANLKCACACYTCDTVPCVCKYHQCQSDPCVCPCTDCSKYPCVCQCTECDQPLKDCICMVANDNDSEVIIQRRPDENHADDEDTETVVKFIVSENVHDNESIASENCIEDEAKQDSEAKIQLDGSDKIGKTDVSNLTIVEVEVHNEQNGAPDGLKRKRPISEDGIDDNDDHRTDSSIETTIIESESLVAGTDRELSEGKKIKRDDDIAPSCDAVVGGSDEINDVDMENSLSLNGIIGTPVGDEVITTEGAKENEELSVCSGDGYESSVEILDINSDGDVKNVDKFISAKQARKLKKKKRKSLKGDQE